VVVAAPILRTGTVLELAAGDGCATVSVSTSALSLFHDDAAGYALLQAGHPGNFNCEVELNQSRSCSLDCRAMRVRKPRCKASRRN